MVVYRGIAATATTYRRIDGSHKAEVRRFVKTTFGGIQGKLGCSSYARATVFVSFFHSEQTTVSYFVPDDRSLFYSNADGDSREINPFSEAEASPHLFTSRTSTLISCSPVHSPGRPSAGNVTVLPFMRPSTTEASPGCTTRRSTELARKCTDATRTEPENLTCQRTETDLNL